MRNPYDILEIESRWASQDDIKVSYRRLALKYHPDRNRGSKYAEHLFKEINWAYSILSNKEERREFDWNGIEEEETTGPLMSKFTNTVKEVAETFKEKVKKNFGKRLSNLQAIYKVIKEGEDYNECPECGGEGLIEVETGFFTSTKLCEYCKGKGFEIFKKPIVKTQELVIPLIGDIVNGIVRKVLERRCL